VRLYEAPPRGQPARFGQQFAMLYRPMARAAYQAGDTINLALWWRALEAVPRDYSYGLYLRRANQPEIVAQVDAGLTADGKPTSQWAPSGDYTFGRLSWMLPDTLDAGEYDLWLSVYYWETPEPLRVRAGADYETGFDGTAVRLETVEIRGGN
jgi:hypothetical protein